MAHALTLPPPGFDELTVDEQLDYLHALWDRITSAQELPVPNWHRRILEERLGEYRANPDEGQDSEEFLKELKSELQSTSTRS